MSKIKILKTTTDIKKENREFEKELYIVHDVIKNKDSDCFLFPWLKNQDDKKDILNKYFYFQIDFGGSLIEKFSYEDFVKYFHNVIRRFSCEYSEKVNFKLSIFFKDYFVIDFENQKELSIKSILEEISDLIEFYFCYIDKSDGTFYRSTKDNEEFIFKYYENQFKNTLENKVFDYEYIEFFLSRMLSFYSVAFHNNYNFICYKKINDFFKIMGEKFPEFLNDRQSTYNHNVSYKIYKELLEILPDIDFENKKDFTGDEILMLELNDFENICIQVRCGDR